MQSISYHLNPQGLPTLLCCNFVYFDVYGRVELLGEVGLQLPKLFLESPTIVIHQFHRISGGFGFVFPVFVKVKNVSYVVRH